MRSRACVHRGDGRGTRPRHGASRVVIWRDGDVRLHDVPSTTLVWIAAGVGVSVDNPDTLHVRDATQNWQAHAEHSQPYVGRGLRR